MNVKPSVEKSKCSFASLTGNSDYSHLTREDIFAMSAAEIQALGPAVVEAALARTSEPEPDYSVLLDDCDFASDSDDDDRLSLGGRVAVSVGSPSSFLKNEYEELIFENEMEALAEKALFLEMHEPEKSSYIAPEFDGSDQKLLSACLFDDLPFETRAPLAPVRTVSHRGTVVDLVAPGLVGGAAYKVFRGLDRLEVNGWYNFSDPAIFEYLNRVLEELREVTTYQDFVPVCLGGKWFNLMRVSGMRHFKWCLVTGDVKIYLSRRDALNRNMGLRVIIGSMTCQLGAFVALREIFAWLGELGLGVVRTQVSRVDLAVDLLGVDISEIEIGEDYLVTHAKKFSVYSENRELTGAFIGAGGAASLRIYDKIRELKTQSKAKRDFFMNFYELSSLEGVSLTRFEVQLRRSILKEFRIIDDDPRAESERYFESVEDLIQGLNALWGYSTTHWARYAERPVDREGKNQARIGLSDFWKVLVLVDWGGVDKLERRKRRVYKDVDAIEKQAVGCLLTSAAASGVTPDEFEEPAEYCDFVEDLIIEKVRVRLRMLMGNIDEFIESMRGRIAEVTCAFDDNLRRDALRMFLTGSVQNFFGDDDINLVGRVFQKIRLKDKKKGNDDLILPCARQMFLPAI